MLWAGSAQAVTLQQVGAGFEEPIYVTSDPGIADQLFVVERKRAVVLVQTGKTNPFGAHRSEISRCGGERDLLAVTLSRDLAARGRYFLAYTEKVGEPDER